jgi:hypothetical protein
LLAVVALGLASLACNAVSGGDNNITINNSTNNTNDQNTNSGGNGISVTTANITNAHLSKDKDDTAQTTGYTPTDAGFYCYIDLNNAPDSTVVKGTWTLVSAEGYDSNSEIDSAEITGGDNTYYFSLDRGADNWPVGKYKIDLYIDGELVQTIDFEVQ